jgi:hypothetical protein
MIKRSMYLLLLVMVISVATFFIVNTRLAANEDSAAGLSAKIDKVLANQQQMLKKLDDITAELKIVKIRATR